MINPYRKIKTSAPHEDKEEWLVVSGLGRGEEVLPLSYRDKEEASYMVRQLNKAFRLGAGRIKISPEIKEMMVKQARRWFALARQPRSPHQKTGRNILCATTMLETLT